MIIEVVTEGQTRMSRRRLFLILKTPTGLVAPHLWSLSARSGRHYVRYGVKRLKNEVKEGPLSLGL